MDKQRLKRIESLLRENLAELILKSVKDPRIDPLLSITDIKVSSDLSQAKVYISYYGELEKSKVIIKTLNHAAPFFQREIGKRVRLRTIPHLIFLYDNSIERGFKVTEILKKIVPH